MPPALASPGFGWHETALGTCASLVRESVSPSACGSLPYIGLEHIGQGTLALLGTGTAQDVESTKTAFRTGDILFGKLRPYFRKVVRTRFDGICSTDIWVVRPRKGVDTSYLFYLLASNPFIDFANQGAEGTRMPRAKWQQVSRFPVRLPPIAEQCAIAQVLGAFDDKIELNRRMSETLEEMVRTIFSSFFSATSASVCIERALTSLGSLFDLNPRRPLIRGQVAPYVDMANMPTKTHAPRSVARRRYSSSGTRFQNGDTLVARITPCLENGKTAYVDFLREREVGWGSTEFVVMRPKRPLPNEFAYCLARESTFRQFAIQNMVGSSGRQRVSAKTLSEYPIRVPNERDCLRFGNHATPLMARSGMLNREAKALVGLRDTLLPKLLSGEIRIQDAEKIAETAT